MNNPFEVIEARLSSIENLILDLKHQPKKAESTEPTEQFFTVREAAEFLSLTVPTLYTKCSRNTIPFMKRGNRLYFSSTELMEYLKEGRRKSTSEIEAEAEAYLSASKKGLNNGR